MEGLATESAAAEAVAANAFLHRERELLESTLPGFAAQVEEVPLLDREKEESGMIAAFRDAGGPGVVVPSVHGGIGLSAVDAVRFHRALGSLSPSLAVAVTMHN